MAVLPMIKNRIDRMPYGEMLRHYHSSTGGILFQGEHRAYFEKVMRQKKLGVTNKEHQRLSDIARRSSYKRM